MNFILKCTLLFLIIPLNLHAKTVKEIFKGTIALFDETFKFNNIKAANLKPVLNYQYHDLKEKKKLVFLILGDQGTGKKEQLRVAKSAFEQCQEESGCDFIVGMGDNIYDNGLENSKDNKLHPTDLKQIINKFERPYEIFGKKDFWLSAGNHDWRGNIQQAINYTTKSKIWKFPHNHYKIKGLPNWIHIYALDTTRIKVLGDKDRKFTDQLYDSTKSETKEKQLSGIMSAEKAICKKKGWRMIYGHHPILTSGSHGRHNFGTFKKTVSNLKRKHGFIPEMRKRLIPFMHKCKIQIFMAGHEHHMEHLSGKYTVRKITKGSFKSINPKLEGHSIEKIKTHYLKKYGKNFLGLQQGTFQQVLQGASGKVRKGVKFDLKKNIGGVTNYMTDKAKENYGFTIAHATPNSLEFKYYAVEKSSSIKAKLLKSVSINLDGTTKKVGP